MDKTSTETNKGVSVFTALPCLALRPFVQRFLVVGFPALLHDQHLPDTGPVAAFSFREGCYIDDKNLAPPIAFTGLWNTLRKHKHLGGHRVLITTFTPTGAAALLRCSLDAFADQTVDLSAVVEAAGDLTQLRERFAEASNHEQRIHDTEAFLLARLRFAEPDPLIEAAVAWLERRGGTGRMSELTQFIGLSQSALERRFRRVVGVSPKRFAALVRLRRAVALRETGANYAHIAHEAGYYDQPHFIKEFRQVTGRAPARFFDESTVP